MSKIIRPSMPFQSGIPGGLQIGKMIEIKGRVAYASDRFQINLLTGFEPDADRALHFGIRFDQNCVVRNHLEHGQWGPEERLGAFPFSFGREFKMMIVVDRNAYRVAVNNEHCWDFRHRLPFQRVKSLSMSGPIEVYEIDFNDGRNPVQPARPTLQPVYNPGIPCSYPIYGGLQPGMTIHISGRPSFCPHKFTINLQKSSTQRPVPDIAFHFDPRFFNWTVVRNTRSNGEWASEETFISHFPFQPGLNFNLAIRVETDRFTVSVDGQHFTDFRHRLRPLQMFDTLYIDNDVSISSIRVA